MKRQVRRLFNRLGFDLVRAGREGWTPTKLRQCSEARTVIDVGVWRGTPHLYAAFPDAHLLLVDPLPEALPFMRQALQGRNGAYEAVALGPEPGEATLSIPSDTSMSTLKGHASGDRMTVPMVTLDAVMARHDFPQPYLLKLDVEGYEVPVVKGAADTLAGADCIIAEMLFIDDDSEPPSALIGLLGAAGFELMDLIEVRRSPATTLLRRMDVAFTRR